MIPAEIGAEVLVNAQRLDDALARREILVKALPYNYAITLHMPCNERCIMCVPNGHHRGDSMSFNGFRRLFEQVKDTARHLTLIGGETLLYPRIHDVLDFLSCRPMAVTLITNATTLDDAMCDRLVRLHELNLKCSIDAATPRTYHRIRGKDWFGRVWANVERFARFARGRGNMKLVLVYVVMRENLNEVMDFVDIAAPLAPHRIEFHPVRQVEDWVVDNRTGWTFDGQEQFCEAFRDVYNRRMDEAAARCAELGISCETLYV